MTQVNPAVEKALQQATVDLLALSLQGKQAHWNIKGLGFQSLHEQLDLIVDEVRIAYDETAERLVALGGNPDTRLVTVMETASIEDLPAGSLDTTEMYKLFAAKLAKVSAVIAATVGAVDEADHLSADLLIGIARDLDKQAWFLRASVA